MNQSPSNLAPWQDPKYATPGKHTNHTFRSIRLPATLLAVTGLLAVLIWPQTFERWAWLDQPTDAFFASSMTQAGVAYGSVRALNAMVSMIKESELHVEPAGVGVSLALGQALDPIDDMTERLADILVLSIASIGLQQFLYRVSVWLTPVLLAALLLAGLARFWISNPAWQMATHWAWRVALILVVMRCLFPLNAWISQQVDDGLLQSKYQTAQQALITHQTTQLQWTDLNAATPSSDHWWQRFSQSIEGIGNQASQLKQALDDFKANSQALIAHLLAVALHHLALFALQVFVLPLFNLWLLWQLFRKHPS